MRLYELYNINEAGVKQKYDTPQKFRVTFNNGKSRTVKAKSRYDAKFAAARIMKGDPLISGVKKIEHLGEYIKEAKEQTVGLIFGRFNPPHKGHKAAWEMASKNDDWYVGTNQSTQGPKDPLPYDVKIKAMEAIMPEIAGHIVPHQSWLTLASKIYEEHGKVVLRVYTDEKWVLDALAKYNGVSKPDGHGFYDFVKIESVKTPRLSSATAVRDAVKNDDRQAFEDAAGVPASFPIDGHEFFEVVKKYLSVHAK